MEYRGSLHDPVPKSVTRRARRASLPVPPQNRERVLDIGHVEPEQREQHKLVGSVRLREHDVGTSQVLAHLCLIRPSTTPTHDRPVSVLFPYRGGIESRAITYHNLHAPCFGALCPIHWSTAPLRKVVQTLQRPEPEASRTHTSYIVVDTRTGSHLPWIFSP